MLPPSGASYSLLSNVYRVEAKVEGSGGFALMNRIVGAAAARAAALARGP